MPEGEAHPNGLEHYPLSGGPDRVSPPAIQCPALDRFSGVDGNQTVPEENQSQLVTPKVTSRTD